MTHLEARVIKAANLVLEQQGYVSPVEVMISLGWLQPALLQDWRRGRVLFLERVMNTNLNKLAKAMKHLKQWALSSCLKPSQTIYMSHGSSSRVKLRFSKSGHPNIEQAYSTHYISPILSKQKIEKLKNKWEQSPNLVVFSLISETECSNCHKELHKGNLLFKDGDNATCVDCSQLRDLIFLPSGNAALSRKAKKYSSKHAVVVKFSCTRKRYERQGIMVEEEALKKAQSEIS